MTTAGNDRGTTGEATPSRDMTYCHYYYQERGKRITWPAPEPAEARRRRNLRSRAKRPVPLLLERDGPWCALCGNPLEPPGTPGLW